MDQHPTPRTQPLAQPHAGVHPARLEPLIGRAHVRDRGGDATRCPPHAERAAAPAPRAARTRARSISVTTASAPHSRIASTSNARSRAQPAPNALSPCLPGHSVIPTRPAPAGNARDPQRIRFTGPDRHRRITVNRSGPLEKSLHGHHSVLMNRIFFIGTTGLLSFLFDIRCCPAKPMAALSADSPRRRGPIPRTEASAPGECQEECPTRGSSAEPGHRDPRPSPMPETTYDDEPQVHRVARTKSGPPEGGPRAHYFGETIQPADMPSPAIAAFSLSLTWRPVVMACSTLPAAWAAGPAPTGSQLQPRRTSLRRTSPRRARPAASSTLTEWRPGW